MPAFLHERIARQLRLPHGKVRQVIRALKENLDFPKGNDPPLAVTDIVDIILGLSADFIADIEARVLAYRAIRRVAGDGPDSAVDALAVAILAEDPPIVIIGQSHAAISIFNGASVTIYGSEKTDSQPYRAFILPPQALCGWRTFLNR